MTPFDVHANDDGTFTVTTAGRHPTTHHVTVPPDMMTELRAKRPELTPDVLVSRSFAFLLEREPSSSILHAFTLDVIGRYFPEYPDEIRRRL